MFFSKNKIKNLTNRRTAILGFLHKIIKKLEKVDADISKEITAEQTKLYETEMNLKTLNSLKESNSKQLGKFEKLLVD